VRAARAWVRRGNVGAVTFEDCCNWLGMDAERTRISSVARGYGRRLGAWASLPYRATVTLHFP
jgi:hypothetical protein